METNVAFLRHFLFISWHHCGNLKILEITETYNINNPNPGHKYNLLATR